MAASSTGLFTSQSYIPLSLDRLPNREGIHGELSSSLTTLFREATQSARSISYWNQPLFWFVGMAITVITTAVVALARRSIPVVTIGGLFLICVGIPGLFSSLRISRQRNRDEMLRNPQIGQQARELMRDLRESLSILYAGRGEHRSFEEELNMIINERVAQTDYSNNFSIDSEGKINGDFTLDPGMVEMLQEAVDLVIRRLSLLHGWRELNEAYSDYLQNQVNTILVDTGFVFIPNEHLEALVHSLNNLREFLYDLNLADEVNYQPAVREHLQATINAMRTVQGDLVAVSQLNNLGSSSGDK